MVLMECLVHLVLSDKLVRKVFKVFKVSPEQLVQRARLLSAQTLRRARVLVPASPGVKRLQAIVYTQLQRAMLGQISSDAALAEAERQWNAYAVGRFARQTGR